MKRNNLSMDIIFIKDVVGGVYHKVECSTNEELDTQSINKSPLTIYYTNLFRMELSPHSSVIIHGT